MAPKNSKRDVSDDSSDDSGSDNRNPPPKKSKPTDKGKSTKTSSKEEENSWLLDNNRFVKVTEFKGKIYVNIREYYEKNGELLPSKKGISLSMSQWNKFKDLIDDIQEAIEKL